MSEAFLKTELETTVHGWSVYQHYGSGTESRRFLTRTSGIFLKQKAAVVSAFAGLNYWSGCCALFVKYALPSQCPSPSRNIKG